MGATGSADAEHYGTPKTICHTTYYLLQIRLFIKFSQKENAQDLKIILSA